MSSDNPLVAPGAGDLHRDCRDLLPWLVTGRLAGEERQRVEAHLQTCGNCREELVAQRELRERMAADDGVSYSPAASFEKLWSRIEELERETPGEATRDESTAGLAGGGESHREALPSRQFGWQRAVRPSRLPFWLAAAVIVQAIALAWLVVGLRSPDGIARDSGRAVAGDSWPYQTASSNPPAPSSGAVLRVVFESHLTLGQLQQTLEKHGLVIVHGAAASGVLTVIATGKSPEEAALLVERLADEPGVRFAGVAGRAGSP